MPYYEWRGDVPFQDHRNDREIEPGDVVELPERVAGNHDFVQTEPPEQDDTGGSDDTPLSERPYQELRQMAVDADTDAINGNSSRDEIIAYFSEDQ